MKKLLLVTLLFSSSTLAFAQQAGSAPYTGQGGYTGPSNRDTVVSVSDAKSMRDDARVTLKGKIIKHLYKDKYLFSDGKDEITIEIDNAIWKDAFVGPDNNVTIMGEIDRDYHSAEIEVDYLRIIE